MGIDSPESLLSEVVRQTQIELQVISLRELEARTGVSKTYLSHLKKGEHSKDIGILTVFKLANYFKIPYNLTNI